MFATCFAFFYENLHSLAYSTSTCTPNSILGLRFTFTCYSVHPIYLLSLTALTCTSSHIWTRSQTAKGICKTLKKGFYYVLQFLGAGWFRFLWGSFLLVGDSFTFEIDEERHIKWFILNSNALDTWYYRLAAVPLRLNNDVTRGKSSLLFAKTHLKCWSNDCFLASTFSFNFFLCDDLSPSSVESGFYVTNSFDLIFVAHKPEGVILTVFFTRGRLQ